ncbi:MAG: type IV pili methyl-accepting chemotaxis transducer N-terminal domain-containing protein, partial [Kiloniellales bacterium]|nr:type IV pili methyl-accepting chemotaxis transducer N-terminal domain-containing protein [Kiloniellales bacterium]
MGKKASKAKIQIAGLLSAVILVLAVSPAEANKQNNRSFTMAERQLLLLERMTNSALLAALGIDAAPRLGSIHWSRFRFDTMQKELRQGNPGIGLVPTTKPELVQALDRVDALWRRYDSLFVEVAKSKKISREQMTALTASHAETLEALA